MVDGFGSFNVLHRGSIRNVFFPRKAGDGRGENQMGGQQG